MSSIPYLLSDAVLELNIDNSNYLISMHISEFSRDQWLIFVSW